MYMKLYPKSKIKSVCITDTHYGLLAFRPWSVYSWNCKLSDELKKAAVRGGHRIFHLGRGGQAKGGRHLCQVIALTSGWQISEPSIRWGTSWPPGAMAMPPSASAPGGGKKIGKIFAKILKCHHTLASNTPTDTVSDFPLLPLGIFLVTITCLLSEFMQIKYNLHKLWE